MLFAETEHLLIRKVRPTDFEDYFRADLMDREMDRLMCRSSANTPEEVVQGFDWFLNKEERAYVIVHKESGAVIGNLTVCNRVPGFVASQPQVAGKTGKSLSFALAPQWRRQGFMAEAVKAVMDILFTREQVDYINCGYLSFNHASEGFQKSLGFTYLATEIFEFEGTPITSVENILIREQWQHWQKNPG